MNRRTFNRRVEFTVSTIIALLLACPIIAVEITDTPRNVSATNPATVSFRDAVLLHSESSVATARYVLSPGESKFIAHARAGGLLWFKGHDHYLAARDFSREAEITPGSIIPASLRLVVKGQLT